MSEAMHRAALAGNKMAREAEKSRIADETESIDVREKDHESDHNCYSAAVHDSHDYDDVVWAEPRWVNPRTLWRRWCSGVQDESPYEKIVESGDRGVWVWEQDDVAPPGEFAICRRLILSGGPEPGTVHVDVEIWKSPPREWPPVHAGSNGAGLRLGPEEARAMRDWLTGWLERHGG